MSIESWLNRSAARARLTKLDGRIQRLQQEKQLLAAAVSFARRGPGEIAAAAVTASDVGLAGRRGRAPATNGASSGGRGGESMTILLADTIAAGPAGKGWTIGELVAALGKTHPERVKARNASSLISAALAQALRAKEPQFVSRKRRGKRSHLYRLARATSK